MKLKKILCYVLVMVTALSCLFGCKKGGDGASDNAAEKNENPVILLNGFESSSDLNTLMMYEYLGKAEIETENSAYIKSGGGSGKITVQKNIFGGSRSNVDPYLFQSTRNIARGLDENDFSYTAGIGLDVYNPQNEEKQIGIRLVYKRNYNMVTSLEKTEWYTLKPESWTVVHMDVIRSLIPMRTVTATSTEIIPVVIGIDMLFKTPPQDKSDDIFYVDDIRLFKTTEPYEPAAVSAAKKHEICSFDYEWQINNLSYSNNVSYLTSVSQSKAFTSDGAASLKIETGGLTYIQMKKSRYFPDMELADYKDDDVFRMEIYSPKENGYSGDVILFFIGAGGAYFFRKQFTASPGSLTYVSVPVSEIDSAPDADVSTGNCFEFITSVSIAVRDTNTPQLLYIDNLRMEVSE